MKKSISQKSQLNLVSPKLKKRRRISKGKGKNKENAQGFGMEMGLRRLDGEGMGGVLEKLELRKKGNSKTPNRGKYVKKGALKVMTEIPQQKRGLDIKSGRNCFKNLNFGKKNTKIRISKEEKRIITNKEQGSPERNYYSTSQPSLSCYTSERMNAKLKNIEIDQ